MVEVILVVFCCVVVLLWLKSKKIIKEQEFSKDACGKISMKDTPDRITTEKGKHNILEWSVNKKIECLERQKLLHKVSKSRIKAIAQNGIIKIYEAHSIISSEGVEAEEIYFIFDGGVDILERGLKVAERGVGESVGEIPLLNPAWRRSGTIRASQRVTLLALSYKYLQCAFDEGRNSCQLLHNMSLILAGRLRERGRFQRVPNQKPRIFIGSSTKSLMIAQKVKKELEGDRNIEVVLWTEGVFKPSLTSIESLEKFAETCDFAVIVFGADDSLVLSDGSSKEVPRDNVIFELGLFMGVLGRDRSFFLVDNAKRPTDLDGVTYEKYYVTSGVKKDKINVKNAVIKIRSAIKEKKVR